MSRRSAFRLACGLGWGALSLGPSSLAETPDAVDGLSQNGIQSAFQILRERYIHREGLNFEQLNRAALGGLIQQLGNGAELQPAESLRAEEGRPPQVHSQMLSKHIGWLRPTTFHPEEIDLVRGALEELEERGARALVLDLRSPSFAADFDVAAAVLDLFFPSGEALFRLRRLGSDADAMQLSRNPAAWDGPLVALVDEPLSSTAEVIAAVLQQERRSILIGAPTPGATVEFEVLPVDADWSLRYASSEMLLNDETSLFREGLRPELEVAVGEASNPQAVRLIEQGRVRELVHETARERFNEAALVDGRNPELQSYLNRSLGRANPEDRSPTRDLPLQRAVDLLQSQDHLEGAEIDWDLPEQRSSGPAEQIAPAQSP